MAHVNVPPPRFGKAGNAPSTDWGDVDHFDVDMLAEYLLEDGNLLGSGVAFDFKYVHKRLLWAQSSSSSSSSLMLEI